MSATSVASHILLVSMIPFYKQRATGWNRTTDPQFTKLLLFLLSYDGTALKRNAALSLRGYAFRQNNFEQIAVLRQGRILYN